MFPDFEPAEILEPIRTKFARAWDHLEVIHEELVVYHGGDATGIDREFNPQTRQRTYRFRIIRPLPPTVAILVGEALYNLMSGLDHLANLLTPEGAEPTTFPIFKNRSRFQRTGRDGTFIPKSGEFRIRDMPCEAKRLVREVQPYQRGNDSQAHPLWLLHELANHDKHHALILSTSTSLASHLVIQTVDGPRLVEGGPYSMFYGPKDDGSVLATVSIPPDFSDDEFPVSIKAAFTETIAEPNIEPAVELVAVLNDILEYVIKDVMMLRIEPYFASLA